MQSKTTLIQAALFLTANLFLTTVSIAQVHQDWVKKYNGPANNDDGARALAVDGSGNVYVTGESYGSGTNYDFATIKYKSSGVQQWVQRYNGPGNNTDIARSVAVDGSGNAYVTGESYGSGTNYDFAIIKYNSSGVLQWVQRYNGPGNSTDVARSIVVDGSGNVYVTGESYGSGTDYDYATLKYNSSGVQQWEVRYNGPANSSDYVYGLAVDGSGNVYVTGSSIGNGTGSDHTTLKYNSSGVQQWEARYNGPANGDDNASSIAVDGSGNVYVTGSSTGSGTSRDYATLKYNSSGVEQWVQRYNGPGNGWDYAASLAVDGSAYVYVTGNSWGSETISDYATLKYNSSGVEQWVSRYNGPGNDNDFAWSLALDGSGNVYVTGQSTVSGNDYHYDYATLKYNSSGVQQWLRSYNGPGNSSDIAHSLAVDGSGNVYVTGESMKKKSTGDPEEPYFYIGDYVTIKYSQTNGNHLISIEPISNEMPDRFSFLQIYPNPVSTFTTISFYIGQTENVSLQIFDASGRLVTTLADASFEKGYHEITWNVEEVNAGMYFLLILACPADRVTAGYSENRKLIVTK